MFYDDCADNTESAIVAEGRRRQRASGGAQPSDEQHTRWLADGRARGARLTLTLDGLMFVDERHAMPTEFTIVNDRSTAPVTLSPIGDKADPLASFDGFVSAVRARLEAGRAEYGDRSFSRPPAELIGELQQEALDLAAWGFALWCRLEGPR